MPIRHPTLPAIQALPDIWLISDARNDSGLEAALKRLPRGSGLIFRHYHLNDEARRKHFAKLARLARSGGHVVALSGSAREARRWKAAGAYGPPSRLGSGPAALRLVTAHSLREIGMAHRARAHAILLSPVFATRSHPVGKVLGPVRFRLFAAYARVPIFALGGMTARRSRALLWKKWAAIDGI